jgi:hypothetical protein
MGAKPRDLTDRDRRDHGVVAKLLAGVDIREVDLDHRPGDPGQRIAKRDAVVGEASGIDDDGDGAGSAILDQVDQYAFVI